MEKPSLKKDSFCLTTLEDTQVLSSEFYQKIKRAMKSQVLFMAVINKYLYLLKYIFLFF